MWGFRWAEYGTDDETKDWFDWNVFILRSHKLVSIKNFAAFVTSADWRVALEMRDGTAWGAATKALIADTDWKKMRSIVS